MGLFSRDRDEAVMTSGVVDAPHPALASLETFRDAPLADAAAALPGTAPTRAAEATAERLRALLTAQLRSGAVGPVAQLVRAADS